MRNNTLNLGMLLMVFVFALPGIGFAQPALVNLGKILKEVKESIRITHERGGDVSLTMADAIARAIEISQEAGLSPYLVAETSSRTAMFLAIQLGVNIEKAAEAVVIGSTQGGRKVRANLNTLGRMVFRGAMNGARDAQVDLDIVAKGLSQGMTQAGLKPPKIKKSLSLKAEKLEEEARLRNSAAQQVTDTFAEELAARDVQTDGVIQNILADPEVQKLLAAGGTDIPSIVASQPQ